MTLTVPEILKELEGQFILYFPFKRFEYQIANKYCLEEIRKEAQSIVDNYVSYRRWAFPPEVHTIKAIPNFDEKLIANIHFELLCNPVVMPFTITFKPQDQV